MKYFYHVFGETEPSDQGELHVLCPFPHKGKDGQVYYEKKKSAHINVEKEVFHCKSCGESHSETSFLAKRNNIPYSQALRILQEMEEKYEDNWTKFQNNLKESPGALQTVRDLGLSDVADDLRIGFEGAGISFPVFMNGVMLAKCQYRPDRTDGPKAFLSKGAKNLIFPYDLWLDDDRPTVLCAGFKDASIARAKGFNAITFTHGEQSFPKLFKASFRNKTVYIAYDNDGGGKEGTLKAATFIKEAGGTPLVVDISLVCKEEKEDVWDFFMKYNKTTHDFHHLLDKSVAFNEEDYEKERNKVYPLVKLEESTQGKYLNRVVSSRVTVVAKWETIHSIPEVVDFYKWGETEQMEKGVTHTWTLDEENLKDMLYLFESGLKESAIEKKLRYFARVPEKETGVSMSIRSRLNVFKAVVMDDSITEIVGAMDDGSYKPSELVVYSVGQSLQSGEKVRIFYKPTAHPLQEQRVVGLITNIEESDTAIKNFKITDEVKESLRCFQGSVKEKMKEIAERFKAIAGPETLPQLAWAVDLFYHTPLQFKWGERTERAYLDAMIIGESRTGKSQAAKKALELYELGVFTSLKTATAAGLIGGSDSTAGGFKTKLGVLPRNHKGAVIMEEFSGASRDMVGKLTDIRSSNMVRIDRVNGTTTAPAMVRMLSISNQRKEASGETIPLRQQPSGVDVCVKLVGAAEDVGRYDFFMLVDKPDFYTNPNTRIDLEPFPKDSYLNRVRWVWSRTADQVSLSSEIREYIATTAENLNKKYDSHINFFGPECWKKLTRLAIAVSASVCSTDESYTNIIVKHEHVDWAKGFLVACYDNDLFNLRTFVEEERAYTQCPEASVQALQGLWNQHRTLLVQMERGTDFSQAQLRAMSGLDQKDFNKLFNRLAECYFIQYSRTGERIIPSERFRKAMRKINRNASQYVLKVGSEY